MTSGTATGARTFSTSAARIALTSSRFDRLVVAASADRFADAARRRDTEIGLDQHILELVEHGGIELALGEDIGDALAETVRRAREPRAQALPPAALVPAPARLGATAPRPARAWHLAACAARARTGGRRGRACCPAPPLRHALWFRPLPSDSRSRRRRPGIDARPEPAHSIIPSALDRTLSMTPEELSQRLLYRDGLVLVIDKPAGIAVHKGPKGGESLEEFFARCASACRAIPPSPIVSIARPPAAWSWGVITRLWKNWGFSSSKARSPRPIGRSSRAAREADEGLIDLPLGRLDATRGWWMKVDPRGLPAQTRWRVAGRGAAAVASRSPFSPSNR